MKQVILLCTMGLFTLCAGAQQKQQVKTSDADLPYKAKFSTNFSMGNPQYARMVLNAWKDWDDNMLDRTAPMIGDDISAVFADGSVIKGKDEFIKAGKAFRSNYSSVKSEVVTYTTLKINDAGNEEVVLIWGNETSTKKDGTVEKNSLHEVWIFKNGQVSFLQQWMARPPKEEM